MFSDRSVNSTTKIIHFIFIAAQESITKELDELLTDLLGKKKTTEVCASGVLGAIKEQARNKATMLAESSRTAALWIQYMNMIDILRSFIRAERTSNWELHLRTLTEMLPYLVAAGHNLYVKCARLYLQEMASLPNDHPDVHEKFMSGYHSVRRSDRFWSGLSTDLIIEQVLMRSVKTSGGLTRGKGINEHRRLVWLLSMPICAETNRVMQSLSGVDFNSGEQNKDICKARMQRDLKDTVTVLTSLAERSPIAEDPSLRNIMTGVNADSNVNVDAAAEVGTKVLESMTGKSVCSYSFSRCAQAITMASKSSLTIGNESVQVDPQLLFQRLILACNSAEELTSVFQYELASYPTALFESPLMMNPAQKPGLADAIWSTLSPGAKTGPTTQVHYVLDGGALLHRVPWPRGNGTYRDVLAAYTSYVSRKYRRPTVVFDGYDDISTKYSTQKRRAAGKVAPTISFTEDMQVTSKREEFLSNAKNKQRFINLLSDALCRANCQVKQAPGDADVTIVRAAVDSGQSTPTVLVGDDTDLLVLLCYHTDIHGCDVFFRPEPKTNVTRRRVWNIKKVKQQLGPEVCENLLFIHAFLGCDTTSRIFGLGKGAALKKFISSAYFREQAKVFSHDSSTQDEILLAGENSLVCLYGGRPGQKLDILRYQKYCEKVASRSTRIQPQSLPPTSCAAGFHSLRVRLQVQQWKEHDAGMALGDWGWNVDDQQVTPVMTSKPPAPAALLQIVRCNCLTDCSSRRCTCRRHGLECSPACGQCKGTGCTNSGTLSEEDADDAIE